MPDGAYRLNLCTRRWQRWRQRRRPSRRAEQGGIALGLQRSAYLEDRTPLRFAQQIEDRRGGFVAPKGYE